MFCGFAVFTQNHGLYKMVQEFTYALSICFHLVASIVRKANEMSYLHFALSWVRWYSSHRSIRTS